MIEVLTELEDFPAELARAVENAAAAALEYERAAGGITILVVDDEVIQTMNREDRGIDRATDVLSYPANEGDELVCIPDGFLGDIVISLPRAQAQAEEYGHSLLRELSFLAVHGTLHLLGYDHMQEEERAAMFARQEAILEKMKVKR